MKLGITGTYSSGKTLTSLLVSNYLGMPRTEARTMREILPEAVPGKTLEQCTSAELIQMIVTRHTERVLHEARHAPSFVSDGCSLQEWIYGSVRVRFGINPNVSAHLSPEQSVEKTAEIFHFEDVMSELGKLFKRHVQSSFDHFVHLKNELPLAKDGHRPVNENFRSSSDELLKNTFDELGMKYAVISGSLEERAHQISDIAGRSPVMALSDAIELSKAQYQKLIL